MIMHILLITHFFVGFMVSEIGDVRIRALSVFGYFPLPELTIILFKYADPFTR